MKLPLPLQIVTVGSIGLILVSAVTAVAAMNTVPSTHVSNQGFSIGVNDLKPSTCGGIFLTSLVTGSGIINGTAGNDLIIGSAGGDIIDGGGGDDCILGGGGGDTCTGGAGIDVFVSCESEIP